MDFTQRSESKYDESQINCDTLAQRDQRSLIFHVLYALDAFDYQVSLESVVDNFGRGFDIIIPHTSEVFLTAQAIAQERNELDEIVKPLLDNWRFDRLGVCTRLILRLAIWELNNTDLDQLIVVNEAIELAKCFAEKDAYKFINGILDQLIKKGPENVPLTESA